MRSYGPGTKAYIDSFNGLVPCVVVEVIPPHGDIRKHDTRVIVRITRTGKGYRAGELVEFGPHTVPPRDCVRRKRLGVAIRMDYQYVPPK